MRRGGDDLRGERERAVGISVVGKHARRRHRQRRVFVGDVAVAERHRRVVPAHDGDQIGGVAPDPVKIRGHDEVGVRRSVHEFVVVERRVGHSSRHRGEHRHRGPGLLRLPGGRERELCAIDAEDGEEVCVALVRRAECHIRIMQRSGDRRWAARTRYASGKLDRRRLCQVAGRRGVELATGVVGIVQEQVAAAEVALAQIPLAEVAFAEVALTQVAFAEVALAQVALAEVALAQVALTEIPLARVERQGPHHDCASGRVYEDATDVATAADLIESEVGPVVRPAECGEGRRAVEPPVEVDVLNGGAGADRAVRVPVDGSRARACVDAHHRSFGR